MTRLHLFATLGAASVAGALLFHAPAAAAPPATGPASIADLDRMEKESSAAALAWLARRQEADGHWSSVPSGPHDFTRLYEQDAARKSDVMATSLAMMAFMGAGNSPFIGPYSEVVKRAQGWLVASMDPKGCFVPALSGPEPKSLSEREKAEREASVARLNQLYGTLALLEFVSAVKFDDPMQPTPEELRMARKKVAMVPAVKALMFVTADATDKEKRFDFLNEHTITADDVALLCAIRYVAQRMSVPYDADFFGTVKERMAKIQTGLTEKLVTPLRFSEEGEYWFRGSVASPEVMISAFYLSIKELARPQMDAMGPALLTHPPVWNPYFRIEGAVAHPDAGGEAKPTLLPEDLRRVAAVWKDDIANELSWFWQSMGFRAMGGDEWNQWRHAFIPMAWEHQRRGGMEAGSWDPAGPHARVFGREISTAWMVIAMEPGCRLWIARSDWTKLEYDARISSMIENRKTMKPVPVKCAVCGADTMSTTTFSKGMGDMIYYFESEECQMKFEMNPDKYAKVKSGVGSTDERVPGGGGGEEGHDHH